MFDCLCCLVAHLKSSGVCVYFSSQITQGSKIALVRSYLRVPQAAGQVKSLVFLLKIKLSPCMPIYFVMQGKCLFYDISRPVTSFETLGNYFKVVLIMDSAKSRY